MTNRKTIPAAEMIDPDVRFLLANERTLLAWLRTALGIIAGGIALLHLGDRSTPQRVAGVLVILMGAAASTVGYVRYRAADRAIRTGCLPHAGHGPAIQVAGIVVFAVALIILEIF